MDLTSVLPAVVDASLCRSEVCPFNTHEMITTCFGDARTNGGDARWLVIKGQGNVISSGYRYFQAMIFADSRRNVKHNRIVIPPARDGREELPYLHYQACGIIQRTF